MGCLELVEFDFRIRVALVLVRMELESQTPVLSLYQRLIHLLQILLVVPRYVEDPKHILSRAHRT